MGKQALGEELVRRPASVELPAGDGRWSRRIIVDALVKHRVEAVFPYLADPTRWHDFAPAVEFRKQMDAGPPGVGTTWMATDRIGPFRIHFIDRLDHFDENRSVVWVSTAPWNSRVEYACTPAGDSTRVHAEYEGELGDSLRWQVGWLPIWGWHWILAKDFRRLDRLLTVKARAAGRWALHHGAGGDGNGNGGRGHGGHGAGGDGNGNGGRGHGGHGSPGGGGNGGHGSPGDGSSNGGSDDSHSQSGRGSSIPN